jgi:predicted DNA-binding antitoxin AbrB/MazE fold protein
MGTITIPAIYRNGVIEPQVKLDLPDNTPVQVEVTVLSEDPQLIEDEYVRSLYGKYAEGDDLVEALLRERALERLREDTKLYNVLHSQQPHDE